MKDDLTDTGLIFLEVLCSPVHALPLVTASVMLACHVPLRLLVYIQLCVSVLQTRLRPQTSDTELTVKV